MKHVSSPLLFVLLLATAVLVLVFSFQTRLMDLDRHNEVAQNLLRLKQLDTQLNEETLKIVSLQVYHYDTIVRTVTRMKAVSGNLNDRETGLYGLVGPDVDSGLDTFHALMLNKIDLVESVKSRTAIVRNTLNYVPLELTRLSDNRVDLVAIQMQRLLNTLLMFNLSPNDHNRDALIAELKFFKTLKLSVQDRSDIDKVLPHIKANLRALDETSAEMLQFLNLPTMQTLDKIFRAHMVFTITRIKIANQFRIVLLVLSLVLFAGLGFALFRLRVAHDDAERTSRQFRDAAESIGEGFAFFDAAGKLSFWNKTFEKLHYGVGDALSTGVTFDAFFKACVDNEVYQDFIFDDEHQNENTSRSLGHPYVVQSANGTWMMASDSRMADGGTASVRVDITASKHAEAELRQLSRAVEQSPVSVMITDTNGLITYVNPKFVEATGYASQEAIGQKPNMISSGEMPSKEYDELWQTVSNGHEWRGEFHNKHKDGSLYWEFASISPIKDDRGVITHFLAVKEDITERKRTMRALVEAKEQAELASHTKTQFLANMSHELRTPLNAIIGFSEIIKAQMFGPVGNKNYIEYSANILTSGQHLLHVINDILDVSRIEIGTMQIRERSVNIGELCHDSLYMVRDQAQFSKLTLSDTVQENLPVLRGDPVRIKQIILNLLTNAIKFTPQGGKVDLEVHLDDQDTTIVLVVRDTGCGIPEDKRETILEPFEQVSDIYTRNHEGSGLGLYLVNSFVELHGGTLTIESEVDMGTTVSVRLPIERKIAAQ
ncbi:MAG: PAS domain S-box protein [Magnetovibrio sp.]|nr:PAS domain S-box protein [Magnetovibrio sp.]